MIQSDDDVHCSQAGPSGATTRSRVRSGVSTWLPHFGTRKQRWMACWLVCLARVPATTRAADAPSAVEFTRAEIDEADAKRINDAFLKTEDAGRACELVVRRLRALEVQKAAAARKMNEHRLAKPTLVDSAGKLVQDEFETRDEFSRRVQRAREADQERFRLVLQGWERTLRDLEIRCEEETRPIDQAKAEAQAELSVRDKERGEAMRRQGAPVDCAIQWASPPHLTRFDLEAMCFSSVRFVPRVNHLPAGSSVLFRGAVKGVPVAVCGALPGQKEMCFRANTVDAAKQFKADWEAGRIVVRQAVTVTPRMRTTGAKVIEVDRVVRVDRQRKSFDGEDAMNVIGNLALALMGGQATPEMQAYTWHTADPSRDRGFTEKITEISPEQSFVADVIAADVVLGQLGLFRKTGKELVPVQGIVLAPPPKSSTPSK